MMHSLVDIMNTHPDKISSNPQSLVTDAERRRKALKAHIESIMGKEYTPMQLQQYLCGRIEATLKDTGKES